MTQPLRFIHLESNPADAALIATTLRDAGILCQLKQAQTREEFLAALRQEGFSLVLADTAVPGFDGATALSLARTLHPDVPFLFVSDTQGEEFAIDMMQHGATDYISKQRLGRLVPSIKRTLRELDERLERRRAEDALRVSEKQFRQAQKMEAVGRLAGGLAHDFNNLLTVIMGHSQVLLGELPSGNPIRAKIEEMQKAGERAASLIRQLMAFSRKQPLEPKILPLNSVVGNVESMLRRLIGEDIQLVIRPDPFNGHVKADPGQLEQVLMNLVVNARDAMPNGGLLAIETSQTELARTPMHHLHPLPLGQYVKLTVTDTGCGMNADVLAHLFEPFFTTKEEHKGTGLGLSTVFGIVTTCGGGIDVWSQVGHGTTFDLYFPRVNPQATTADATAPQGRLRQGSETILLVEDDSGVRNLVRHELVKTGYQVIEAKNGVEACLTATQQSYHVDLLLTDVVMPGMNGRELAQHLSVIKPNLRVLFMSGYLDDISVNSGMDPHRTTFLQKPFTPDLLLRTVRALLDSSAPATGSAPHHFPPDQAPRTARAS
ncbi:MAG TPA: response regulator [Nitrospira sp.]|jgi:two-component system cell cycle sensor histidine kinase/response regulator CckA|uniref:response regulator n=1 Tax=Nitrospira sp. ND1 TaxID=1658518 RepID=UPI0009BA5D0E|nr:response regulator [Nitrospira sp. ND1]MBK7418467.1 response regulator [Nitrospira sp.]MBK7484993.1 response regulator [Nitrospira sp.]MBK8376563.1 response regulator [Nitrospira sp.]MBK9998286.1 response regulator [Nitrospira sp.]MBP6200001.1 response regulator [Nitrospira sp.]